MKPQRFLCTLALASALLCSGSSLAADLDSFLAGIDVSAKADLGRFRTELRASFDLSSHEIDGLFEICDGPADVYMTLRIGEIADVTIERVTAEYEANKGKGWGAIAKNLGIKPGSSEFHALKQGRLPANSDHGSSKSDQRDKSSKKSAKK
jgi:hypothetical protein